MDNILPLACDIAWRSSRGPLPIYCIVNSFSLTRDVAVNTTCVQDKVSVQPPALYRSLARFNTAVFPLASGKRRMMSRAAVKASLLITLIVVVCSSDIFVKGGSSGPLMKVESREPSGTACRMASMRSSVSVAILLRWAKDGAMSRDVILSRRVDVVYYIYNLL